ncbi:MAG: mechanosensitive ion channel protein [Phycisphaerae bacterium]|nr:MAG: mechanosensitive ion channel protein [Phycisphaerae bacterium]
MNMEDLMQRGKELVLGYGPSVIAAILTLVFGWILAGILTGMARRIMRRAKLEETLVGFACNIIRMGLLALVVITAIQKLGVPTTSFVAVIGAAGLAVGFALQGSLSNFAAGVMLIIFRPFKVGDFVEAGGTSGVIEEIAVFATTMRTGDNKRIIVPNSNITGGNVINYSANPTRRVDMVVGIGYDDDIKAAKDLLQSLIDADERILKDPAPTIAVSELADSSVNFVVRPWVNSADYWAVKFDMTERVKLAFDEKGISIPYPQTDVHVHQTSVA